MKDKCHLFTIKTKNTDKTENIIWGQAKSHANAKKTQNMAYMLYKKPDSTINISGI